VTRLPRVRLIPAGACALALAAPSAASAAGPELWTARYDGVGNVQEHNDDASAVAVGPDGSKVFVTGTSDGPQTTYPDYATVAYDATTGAKLWARRYSNKVAGYDVPCSLAVAPDGSTVFVTGTSDQPGHSFDYFTIAYDASTGARLWARRFEGGANYDDKAHVVLVSGDGTKVFVAGESWLGPFFEVADYATIAYDATTGTRLWVERYDGPGHNADAPWPDR
jgi:outer membrane protein assembly factor BamB